MTTKLQFIMLRFGRAACIYVTFNSFWLVGRNLHYKIRQKRSNYVYPPQMEQLKENVS